MQAKEILNRPVIEFDFWLLYFIADATATIILMEAIVSAIVAPQARI
jgi:hypothetical protein